MSRPILRASPNTIQQAPQSQPSSTTANPPSTTPSQGTSSSDNVGSNSGGGGGLGNGGLGSGGAGDGEEPRRPPTAGPPGPPPAPAGRGMSNADIMEGLGLNATPDLLAAASTVAQGSPTWAVLRGYRLTASDFAEAVGCSPYGNPHTLLSRKLNAVQNMEDPAGNYGRPVRRYQQQAMQHGRDHEPTAAAAYNAAAPAGTRLEVIGICIHPQHHWLAASPDRLVHHPTDGTGLLEIKCPYSARIPSTLPQHVELQVLTQLACQPEGAGWSWADVFYWTPARTKTFRIQWDRRSQQRWQDLQCRAAAWFFKRFGPSVLEWRQQQQQGGNSQAAGAQQGQDQQLQHHAPAPQTPPAALNGGCTNPPAAPAHLIRILHIVEMVALK